MEQKDTAINLKWYQQTKSDGHGDTDRNLSDGHGGSDRNLSNGHADTDKSLSNSDSIERSSCFPTDGRG